MSSVPKSIKASLYIDGKPAEASIKNVEQVTRSLKKELNNLEVGTDSWNKKMKELQLHERTLKSIKEEVKGVGGAFSGLKGEVGKLTAIGAGYLGFNFITDEFQNIILNNAKLSDSLAGVRKTTGLSEDAVRRLSSELKQLDTRSSQDELLGLAEVAGKLGVSGERDILGFVRAADMINVALGKDLGNAEDAINDLGKLTELFKVKEAYGLEDALIRTGSAINELGAAGSASEGYLVEFTKRMGGVAPQANFSIESILGLAATMDELGQPVEASATALGQFVVSLGKDIPGFAKVAGMSVKDFSDLLKRDGNQALLEVLKNLQSTGQGVAGLAEKMGMVGEDGARATAALGALSNNLDLLVTRQRLANEEFASGTSLQKEFNVQNATLGAVVDRTGKIFHSFTSNTILTDFIKNLVFGFSNLLSWGEKNMAVIVSLTKFLLVGAAAWGSYRVAILLSNTALEVNVARSVLARTASIAFAGAQALLTGNLTRAAAAMRALNLTASANPLGAVVAVVVALSTAIALFANSTSTAKKVQQDFNSIEAEAKKNQLDEVNRIQTLKRVLEDETVSRSKKLAAINQLRQIMPEALKNLSDEELLTNRGTVAINKYIQALEKQTRAEAARAEIRRLDQQNIELENADGSDGNFINEGFQALYGAIGYDSGVKRLRGYNKESNQKTIAENDRRKKAILEKYGADIYANDQRSLTIDNITSGGASIGGPRKESGNKSADKAKKEMERLASELKKIQDDLFKDSLSKNDAEVEAIRQKYQNLRDQAQGNKDRLVEISNLEAKELTAALQKQADDQKKIDEESAKSKEELAQRIYELGLSNEGKDQLAVDQKYEKMILEADRLGMDTTALYRFWEDEKLKILAESNRKQLEETDRKNRETYEKEQENLNKRYQIASSVTGAIGSLFEIMAGNESQYNSFQKAITVAQIAIDTASAISSVTQKNARTSLTPIDYAIKVAASIAVVLANIAKAKATLSKASEPKSPSFSKPAYAEGGFSDIDPAGYVGQPTIFKNSSSGRPFLAGEAGREWIAPNWMLQSPRFANIIGMLEAARKEKRAFADGGFSGSGSVASAVVVDVTDMKVMMSEMMNAIQLVDRKIVVLPLNQFEDRLKERQQAIEMQSA